ncbi:tubulin-tyrosine ligase family protein [Stylonychia lemnae]|uniref:Tubulin-tyrosine ligase family protein n=1 Tax=Stylonychia lemnae TaxID=5949 RepID=A0A078B4C4_STYLE|nr:tubulin-tyrosine ligase family protein [Stylonychia lemnae]|eukprot:CDW88353.1 tubulin-tyrosine ligase family protein [Stylonychia lemnae]
MLLQGANGNVDQIILPKGFESYDKFERKALKLKESLELELEERRQVDDVISFFVSKNGMDGELDLLNDDKFYQPLNEQKQNIQQISSSQANLQNANMNDPFSQIMQRHQLSQQQTTAQLNQQNLSLLQQKQQILNNSQLSTNRDHKLETDTQFSEYLKQSTDDTQSLYTPGQSQSNKEDSDLSKKMFANRTTAQKNKKDLQSFMRDKLAKTKIASESMGVIQQSIAVNSSKNFTKKKKADDTESQAASQTSSMIEKQTIYKPNLKKKQSSTNAGGQNTAISVSNQKAQPQKNENRVTRKESQVGTKSDNKNASASSNKRSLSRQNSIKDNKQVQQKSSQPTKADNQNKGESKKTQDQTIYKPNNMKSRQSSRPPIPKSKEQKPGNQGGNNQQTKSNISTNSVSTLDQNSESLPQGNSIQQWEDSTESGINKQTDLENDMLGQEEIQSKYSDGGDRDPDDEMLDYKSNIENETFDNRNLLSNLDLNLENIQINDQLEPNQKVIKDQTHMKLNQQVFAQNTREVQKQTKVESDEEEEKVMDYGDEQDNDNDAAEEDDFYQPIDDEKNQSKAMFSDNQAKLQQIFDYQSEGLDEDFIQPNQLNVKIDSQQTKQINIQTMPSSTTSKKIRGKVQIYVDEAAISAQQTPMSQNSKIDTVSEQLKLLEQQDLDLDDQQKQGSINKTPVQQATNKRMEQLKQLMNSQDDQKRKQEQEDRLKQVREQMQRDKEVKIKQEQAQIQQQRIEQDLNSSTLQESKKDNTIEQKKKEDKKQSQKKVPKKTQQVAVPKIIAETEQYIDYSGHYKTFYDIFVGQILDPKNFDVSFVIRDTRNMYAAFVNIMDANAINMKKKFQFEQAPLEKSLQDYYKGMPDFFTLTGKSVNELELEMKNRGNEIMMQAMAQQQLKSNFQLLKQKDVNDIVKEANEKAAQYALANPNQIIDENRESSLYYRVVKNRSEVYDIISRAFSRKRRWNELPHGLDLRNSWNLLWTWSKIKIDITKLIVWQKCNHFSGAKNVSRKDFLKRNIERAQKMSSKANQVFNMLPLTFILPKEYVGFLESFSEFEDKEGRLNYWIMKPAAKSRGRGISLVNDLTQITYGEPIVVQRYIKNPLLINGYKFDMRIYVLVTSVNPLEVFLYKEGFGRFSTMPFSLDPTDKNNKYIHLTNVSIQKYNVNNSEQDPTDLLYGGTKISIQTLKKRVQQAANVNWDDQIWPQIRDVVLKSMVACQNDIQFNPCCFELFGFDILIDQDMKCWLIEINSSPSLARETLLDDMIKQRLIDDIIDLVDPIDFDRKRLFEVLERRINEDFKQSTTSNAYSKRLMNRDLTYILNGQVPRKYGEMPKIMGNFERIAPSPQSEQYMKLIGGQKMFGSMMKMQGESEQLVNKSNNHQKQ